MRPIRPYEPHGPSQSRIPTLRDRGGRKPSVRSSAFIGTKCRRRRHPSGDPSCRKKSVARAGLPYCEGAKIPGHMQPARNRSVRCTSYRFTEVAATTAELIERCSHPARRLGANWIGRPLWSEASASHDLLQCFKLRRFQRPTAASPKATAVIMRVEASSASKASPRSV